MKADPAPVDDRERVTTTFHERTARRHDDGRHRGDLPVIGCAYCEMEHPKGRFRTLMAEREGEVLLDRERVPEGWRVEWTMDPLPKSSVTPTGGPRRDPVSITAENGQVVWRMTPNRARKIAALLRAYTRAFSEATRLDTAATEAEQPPRSIHSQ